MNDKKLQKTYAAWSNHDIAASAAEQPPGETRELLLRALQLRTAAHYAGVANGTTKPSYLSRAPQKPWFERLVRGIRTCAIVLFVLLLLVVLVSMVG
jgi:hypothetical protein